MYDAGFATFMVGTFWFIYLASAVVLGIVVGFIGREKGRSGWNWFWAGLFLSLIGLIAVCAVPRVERRSKTISQTTKARWPVIVVTVVVLVAAAWFGLSWAVRDHVRTPAKVAPTASTTTPATAPATPAATVVWHKVARWSGNGMKQTETFSIRSSEWRISWKTMREAFAGAGILQVYVYSDAGELVSLAANRQGIGSDVSYVHAQPGRFYLEISSANVDWEVVVEERY